MIDAERPEALWLALRMVQAVLRESPSALACSSSVRNPADLTASASSLILEDCRAFILAVSGSGRLAGTCSSAAEDGQNTSDECDSMHCFPLVGGRAFCKVNVGSVLFVMAAPQLLALLTPVNLQGCAPAARSSFSERDAVQLASDFRPGHMS